MMVLGWQAVAGGMVDFRKRWSQRSLGRKWIVTGLYVNELLMCYWTEKSEEIHCSKMAFFIGWHLKE